MRFNSYWFDQYWVPFKMQTKNLIRRILNKNDDDNQSNNPFVIF